MGVNPDIVRKIAIAMYEGEINMVIHANGGNIDVEITPDAVLMKLQDHGPGISDIEQAMQEGFSTAPQHARNMGFGAGMGLPNMRKNSDEMEIESTPGLGDHHLHESLYAPINAFTWFQSIGFLFSARI